MSHWRYYQTPLTGARQALVALDDVNSALNWCNGNMPDREGYRAAHEAMWSVAYWIAAQQGPRKMVSGDIGADPFDQPSGVDCAKRPDKSPLAQAIEILREVVDYYDSPDGKVHSGPSYAFSAAEFLANRGDEA